MATALNVPMTRQLPEAAVNTSSTELRSRQQSIAEITEMIHVSDFSLPPYKKVASLSTLCHILGSSNLYD